MFGFFTVDTNLKILQWNAWLADLTGKTDEQVIGRSLEEVFPELRERGILSALHYTLEHAAPMTLSWRFHHHIFAPFSGEPSPQSAVLQPLFHDDTLRGVVMAVQDVSDRQAAEYDLSLRIRQLEILREIDRLVLRGETARAIQTVVDALVDLFDALHAELFLLDEGELRLHAWNGLPPDVPKIAPLEGSLVGRVASTRAPYVSLDVHQETHYLPIDPHTRGEAAVPVLDENGELLGVLNAETASGQALLHGGVMDFLRSMAQQVAVALRAEADRLAARRHLQALQILRSLGVDLTGVSDPSQVGSLIVQAACALFDASAAILYLLEDGEIHPIAYVPAPEPAAFPPEAPPIVQQAMQEGRPLVWHTPPLPAPLAALGHHWHCAAALPLRDGQAQKIGALLLGFETRWKLDAVNEHVQALIGEQLGAQIQKIRRQAENDRRLAELNALHLVSQCLREAKSADDILRIALDTAINVLHADRGAVFRKDPDKATSSIVYARGWMMPSDAFPSGYELQQKTLLEEIIATGQPRIVTDLAPWVDFLPAAARQVLLAQPLALLCAPFKVPEVFDAVMLIGAPQTRCLAETNLRLLDTIVQMTATAIQRSVLHERTRQHMSRLLALSQVTAAINASVDLSLSLGVLLDEAIRQLALDAAGVLLLDTVTHHITQAAQRGMPDSFSSAATHHIMGTDDPAFEVIQNRRLFIAMDIEKINREFPRRALWETAGFRGYAAFPLFSKGVVCGVLELYTRRPLLFDRYEQEFAETLAKVTAMAIEMAKLFNGLQHANMELRVAYDATIEGWARVLELRDYETKGHSDRTTDLTIQLASRMGFSPKELTDIRWGALLHDIGKMGIPDSILHKPGPLSDEEWQIMRQHPVYAYNLLKDIEFLRTALDIPYCHHEKWDGSGYPRGLRGEEIPLPALIFAVVDVWDALRSDRPYREAWPVEKILAYLQTESGRHFAPNVVKVFLELIKENL